MNKITPFLWFDTQAEEAANYYLSIFKNGQIHKVTRGDGKVLTVEFEVEGQRLVGLNGGPVFKFSEAISLHVGCQSQEEVDALWEKLSAGGEKSQCGWVKDKYGLSWQVIPMKLHELLNDPDPKKAGAVMQAMLKMNKIIIADLQAAYDKA